MGLTRPRAAQIFDIDYKQATRVITVANITLAGGAPAVVDGVSLVLNDRVLVTGQTTASQNGLYDVTVVGVGSDGTWARTSDGNTTGEILAGMIVMVTEGALYADTQWKLTTDNPIVIGTTALTFELNTSGNSISNGTSNITVLNNANVNVTVANVQIAAFASTGSYVTGLVSATGNIVGSYILGNGSQLTGLPETYANANVASYLSSGNVTTDIKTTAAISATGNITGGNILGGANVNATTHTGTTVSVTGNITGGNILGNGATLSGINVFSNVTVTGGNSAVADSIADTLTLTAGDGITIVVDSATDTITIGVQSGSEIFVDGADFGTVTEPVTLSDDLGLVTDVVDQEADLGTLVTSGLIYPDQFVLPSYTTSTLPSATVAGAMIYVTNESGGAVPAFADGTNWRRVTDRAIIT